MKDGPLFSSYWRRCDIQFPHTHASWTAACGTRAIYVLLDAICAGPCINRRIWLSTIIRIRPVKHTRGEVAINGSRSFARIRVSDRMRARTTHACTRPRTIERITLSISLCNVSTRLLLRPANRYVYAFVFATLRVGGVGRFTASN